MLSFIPSFLFSKWTVVAVVMVGVWVHGFSWGNDIGSNARNYRAVLAELAKKNVELADLKAKDATETAEEDAARDAAHSTAIKALGNGPKATKAQADLLNSIGE